MCGALTTFEDAVKETLSKQPQFTETSRELRKQVIIPTKNVAQKVQHTDCQRETVNERLPRTS